MTTVGLISLGCAKNLIDSEVMIGHLAQAGMSLTPDPELADVLIINTCSFIDMAKQESIDAIFGAGVMDGWMSKGATIDEIRDVVFWAAAGYQFIDPEAEDDAPLAQGEAAD